MLTQRVPRKFNICVIWWSVFNKVLIVPAVGSTDDIHPWTVRDYPIYREPPCPKSYPSLRSPHPLTDWYGSKNPAILIQLGIPLMDNSGSRAPHVLLDLSLSLHSDPCFMPSLPQVLTSRTFLDKHLACLARLRDCFPENSVPDSWVDQTILHRKFAVGNRSWVTSRISTGLPCRYCWKGNCESALEGPED